MAANWGQRWSGPQRGLLVEVLAPVAGKAGIVLAGDGVSPPEHVHKLAEHLSGLVRLFAEAVVGDLGHAVPSPEVVGGQGHFDVMASDSDGFGGDFKFGGHRFFFLK